MHAQLVIDPALSKPSSSDTMLASASPDVAAAAAGDRRAFERLYRQHMERVHSLCARMLGDRVLAEEVTQDVFVRVWEKLPQFRAESAFGTWLHRVAVNVVLSHRKSVGINQSRMSNDEGSLDAAPTRPVSVGERLDLEAAISGLPNGVSLSSPGKRLGGYLLEGVLMLFTLGVGWLIWSLIVWKDGYTPAKQLLGMRTLRLRTATKATWGTMFVREIIGKFVGGILCALTFGILYFMLIWDRNNQQLWDKFGGTIVVDDPNKVLA